VVLNEHPIDNKDEERDFTVEFEVVSDIFLFIS
jgi:hypothetical protein